MSNITSKKDTIYFLCSPSLGILDNWLPIIWKLKEKRGDIRLIIIFPKASIIDQINLSNVLIILASKVFDSIIFKSHAGHWLVAKSFTQVKKRNKLSKFEWFLLRVIRKLKKWSITRILSRFIQYGFTQYNSFRDKENLFDWVSDINNTTGMLFDVSEEPKYYNASLLNKFKETPKYSICHGIDINKWWCF